MHHSKFVPEQPCHPENSTVTATRELTRTASQRVAGLGVLGQVHLSYLEIYNEAGYDLLDPDREVCVLEDMRRVHVLEDEADAIHMRHLSLHRTATEEEALNLVRSARGWLLLCKVLCLARERVTLRC